MDLFAIVSAFDAAYSAYAAFQSDMERYWCLRWLSQEKAKEQTQEDNLKVEATVLKEEILRLIDIPLVIKLSGMPQVARGSQVKLDLLRWDEVDLTIEARLLDITQDASTNATDELDEELDDELSNDLTDDLLEGDAEPVPDEPDAPAVTEAPTTLASTVTPE